MDERNTATDFDSCSPGGLAQALSKARLRARDVLAAQRERLARLEASLSEQASSFAESQKETERKLELAIAESRAQKRRNAELEEELDLRPRAAGADLAALAALRAEHENLMVRLAKAENARAKPVGDSEVEQKIHDLQRRFEMAVEDLRKLKMRNEELEEKLSAAVPVKGKASERAGEKLDWEAQKLRMLTRLETEVHEDDDDRQQERLTIAGAIDITDEMVAEKDREIAELKRRLEEHHLSVKDHAKQAAAIDDLLDKDEMVRNERQRLLQIQTEWKEKLRQAEIDISLERAKIARRNVELDVKLQAVERELADRQDDENESASGDKAGKPARGRWLARLGLRDTDGEHDPS